MKAYNVIMASVLYMCPPPDFRSRTSFLYFTQKLSLACALVESCLLTAVYPTHRTNADIVLRWAASLLKWHAKSDCKLCEITAIFLRSRPCEVWAVADFVQLSFTFIVVASVSNISFFKLPEQYSNFFYISRCAAKSSLMNTLIGSSFELFPIANIKITCVYTVPCDDFVHVCIV